VNSATAMPIVYLMRAAPSVVRWLAAAGALILAGHVVVAHAAGLGSGDPGGCVGCGPGGMSAGALPGFGAGTGYGSGPGVGPGAHGYCRHGHCGLGHGGPPHGGVGHCGPGGCGHCGHGHCGHGLCAALCGPGSKHDAAEKRYFLRSQGKSWHSSWYDPAEGRPLALVVPPTAEFQTQYGWGVPSSRVMPIYPQFRRPYPGAGAVGGAGGGFMPTPNQPSDTVQFGVNAVRGPWGAY
jgi:hypothetical protein